MNRPSCTFALAGNPNSGKTTLFNRLTGLRHKVGNYPGVTVEWKAGTLMESGGDVEIVDLPGTYSLSPKSEEERIAAEVVAGLRKDLPAPHGVVCVVDATNLERSLYLVLQILDAGVPTIVALNMMDEWEKRGGLLDVKLLSRLLGTTVLPISARSGEGLSPLRKRIMEFASKPGRKTRRPDRLLGVSSPRMFESRQSRAAALARAVVRRNLGPHPWTDRLDAVLLHPVWGPLLFLVVVLVVFQAVFTGSLPFMNLLDSMFQGLRQSAIHHLPDTLWRSLLADGVIAGVGAVMPIFCPRSSSCFSASDSSNTPVTWPGRPS